MLATKGVAYHCKSWLKEALGRSKCRRRPACLSSAVCFFASLALRVPLEMIGPSVEVRKNPKSTTWYNAAILDINAESIKVSFEDQIWASREVPALSVRRCPQENANDDFDPEASLTLVSIS